MVTETDWLIALPKIPETTVNVVDFGAVGDGVAINTRAIQTAIDTCAKTGGGKVIIPPGTWMTGSITLRSHIELHAQAGALVLFVKDFQAYPLVPAQYEGQSTIRCQAPIHADHVQDVAITGEGIFDGGGDAWRPVKKSKMTQNQWQQLVSQGGVVEEKENEAIWWPTVSAMQGESRVEQLAKEGNGDPKDWEAIRDFLRPTLVRIQNCKRVVLDGSTFQNSPSWCLHFFRSEHITIREITVRNPWYAQNGDGIDLESCTNVQVEDSSFDVGDDAICLKSGKNGSSKEIGQPSAYIAIRGCTVFHGHGGFVIGSEMSGGIHDIHVSDCTFVGTDVGLRFKSARGRGGVVERIFVDRIRMADIVKEAISFHMFYDGTENTETPPTKSIAVSEETPIFRDIVIRHVSCHGAKTAILINELPEAPITGLVMEDIIIQAQTGIVMNQGEQVTFNKVNILSTGTR